MVEHLASRFTISSTVSTLDRGDLDYAEHYGRGRELLEQVEIVVAMASSIETTSTEDASIAGAIWW